MKTTITRLLAATAVAGALTLALTPALAADTGPSPTAAPDKLAPVRAQIAQKDFPAAIVALKNVNDTGSADWNNLMGYSLRKAPTPDFAGAEKFYNEALRIDPKHKGALEYSGELYLMLGDLSKAETRLTALNGVCGTNCEEYKDLKAEIERFKSNGMKFVAK